MRFIHDICKPFVLILAVALFAAGSAANAGSQPGGTQDVCVGEPTGDDVFSVGELRTSILAQTPFQEMNGAEWVLADGRPLLVRTALSLHLSEETEYGLAIPDIRGRFLRMANNNVCADLRGDDEAHERCIASRDRDGDRPLGEYQADAFAGHDHGQHRHTYNDVYWSEVPAHGLNPNVDIGDDGPRNSPGHHGGGGYSSDRDNDGFGWDRQSHESVVPASGGLETRPKNIAVNYYIKICNCRTPNCR